jgi:hypothetical protein
MQPLTAYLKFKRHWVGFLFLIPFFPLASIYYARRLAERPPQLGGDLSQHPLTPLTYFLGSSLFWVFWAGVLGFVVHAIYLRHLGPQWMWVKLLLLPFYFVAAFFWSFHPEW